MDGSLAVIGAGFGRTGTMSTKAALEQLGLGPTHHMLEVFARPDSFEAWAAAVRGEPWDPEEVLDGFRSTLDFPSSIVWRQLWEANPSAKVLLTTRSSASWWASFDATIEGTRSLFDAIGDVVFGGRSDDREAAIAAFEAHNADVVASVPEDRLLVYEVGSGWGPLCDFLGVPVPDAPFPSSNSTAEFQARRDGEDDAA